MPLASLGVAQIFQQSCLAGADFRFCRPWEAARGLLISTRPCKQRHMLNYMIYSNWIVFVLWCLWGDASFVKTFQSFSMIQHHLSWIASEFPGHNCTRSMASGWFRSSGAGRTHFLSANWEHGPQNPSQPWFCWYNRINLAEKPSVTSTNISCDLYDMIWYDMIWYDVMWYDMIWYVMRWYEMRWDDMRWYEMRWYMMYDIWYINDLW